MRKTIWTMGVVIMGTMAMWAQTNEELMVLKEAKAAELSALEGELKDLTGKVDALKTEVATLTDQLTPYPRWDVGALGNLGFSVATFTDWLSKSQANTTALTIGFTGNGFANLQQRKYFWRNNANLTVGWLKFDDKDDPTDSDEFKVSADALNVSSLFGYKLSEKLAASVLGEYRTAVLDNRFNDPGYLDVGAGVTWTPITDLVVVFHPLNYNFVFADSGFDYQSSLGCKIVGDYKREITKGIAWKSNLSAFFSYDGSDLSNWTWINGLTTAVKGIGIGFDLGLRSNKQEALAAGLADNPLQTYWIIGLSYAL